MNFKTTVGLMIALVILLAGFFLLKTGREAATVPAEPPRTASTFEQDLFATPWTNLVKISCTRTGQPAWVFQRTNADDSDAQAEWKMIEPVIAAVPKYDVEGIANRLKRLKYQIKYAPDDSAAVTAAQAGLDPPKLDIKLEDQDGKTFAVQIGKAASSSETYVRLDPQGDIYVVRSSLSNLVKKRLNDYRDKTLFKFKADDAKTLEITHRPDGGREITYRLARHSGDWAFEQPFNADALDNPVDAVIRSLSSLRATEWVESDAAGRLHPFGLDQPQLEIKVVCETKTPLPPEPDDDDEADDEAESETPKEPQYEITTSEYVIHIANRSPVGKERNVFAKLPHHPAVGTLSKTTVESLTPDMGKWRNMTLAAADITRATRLEIRTKYENASFTKNDGKWVFEDSGVAADSSSLDKLLKKIQSLRAVSLIDDADPADRQFGLNAPRVVISATVPGRDVPERITVGKATEDVTKRLYYVRRGDSASIAKVRATDVVVLARGPKDYLDPQVFNLNPNDLTRITLSRTNSISQRPETLTLTRQDDRWRLTDPVQADTDSATTTKLANALARLRAETVAAEAGMLTAFGLDSPTVKIDLTYASAPEGADNDGLAEQSDPTFQLLIAEADNKVYAKRADFPAIYKLQRSILKTVQADFHTKSIFNIEQSQVSSFSITSGDVTNRFDKSEGRWIYGNEPDLPLDTKKVDELLTKIGNLKRQRYAEYAAQDLDGYGLTQPARSIQIVVEGAETPPLLVSDRICTADPDKSRYAVIGGTHDVFLVTPDALSEFDISIDELEASADP